jgi:hypothetical protein
MLQIGGWVGAKSIHTCKTASFSKIDNILFLRILLEIIFDKLLSITLINYVLKYHIIFEVIYVLKILKVSKYPQFEFEFFLSQMSRNIY